MRVPGSIWEQTSTLFLNSPRKNNQVANEKGLANPNSVYRDMLLQVEAIYLWEQGRNLEIQGHWISW